MIVSLCHEPDYERRQRGAQTNVRVINNIDGPITIVFGVTTDHPQRNFHTLDNMPLAAGGEIVFNFDRRIAEERDAIMWELPGNVVEMYLKTERVLRTIEVDEQEYKRYTTNLEKTCRYSVLPGDNILRVSEIESAGRCKISQVTHEDYREN